MPDDHVIRERILTRLRQVGGGEFPTWLRGEDAVDRYVDAVIGGVRGMPPWTDERRRRVASLLRSDAGTAASGAA